MELLDGAGRSLVRLEETGPPEKGNLSLRLKKGDKAEIAQVSPKAYQEWQEEMHRLTTPPPKAEGK